MKIDKVQVAHRQLEMAMQLYMTNGDMICAITLAGAAGDIFRNLVERQGGVSTIMFRMNVLNLLGAPREISYFINEMNMVKNFLKHADRDPDGTIEFDEFVEARSLICHALSNYGKLDISSAHPLMEVFYPFINVKG